MKIAIPVLLAGLALFQGPMVADCGGKAAIKVEDLPNLFDPQKMEDPKAKAEAVALLERTFGGTTPPEAVRMLLAILRGDTMNGESGWFGPAQSRYTWKRLAQRSGAAAGKGIAREQFQGTQAEFAILDRNKDGVITPGDLDWSDRNPEVQMMQLSNRVFRKINTGGNGRLAKDEWMQFFEQAARGKDHLTPEDLRDTLMTGMSGGFLPGDAPTQAMLLRGLYEGSLGSMHEGPALDQPAPDFTLKSIDGSSSVQLSKLVGRKPVVLILGNFTCGPYRSLFASIDKMAQRHEMDAHFLMVYVREAHPSDGWKMESNTRVKVVAKQPTTRDERAEVASRFCDRLKPSIPVFVDEIDDRVGHAYSGMPGRFYVIDRDGKIAYKSGRGPFGFRFGEMEQALVMALLEHGDDAKK